MAKKSAVNLEKLSEQTAKIIEANQKLQAKGKGLHNLGRLDTSNVGKTDALQSWGDNWTPERIAVLKAGYLAGLTYRQISFPFTVGNRKYPGTGTSAVANWARAKHEGYFGNRARKSTKAKSEQDVSTNIVTNAALVTGKMKKFQSVYTGKDAKEIGTWNNGK